MNIQGIAIRHLMWKNTEDQQNYKLPLGTLNLYIPYNASNRTKILDALCSIFDLKGKKGGLFEADNSKIVKIDWHNFEAKNFNGTAIQGVVVLVEDNVTKEA